MVEAWLPVVGYEGLYEVSDLGRVRSLDRTILDKRGRPRQLRGKVLKPILAAGYLAVGMSRHGSQPVRRIHTLVLEAFVGPCPDGMECLHGDGDELNARLDNLRWGTRVDNQADSVRHGTAARGSKRPQAKLDEDKVRTIRQHRGKVAPTHWAAEFGVCPQLVHDVLAGKRWRHVA